MLIANKLATRVNCKFFKLSGFFFVLGRMDCHFCRQ